MLIVSQLTYSRTGLLKPVLLIIHIILSFIFALSSSSLAHDLFVDSNQQIPVSINKNVLSTYIKNNSNLLSVQLLSQRIKSQPEYLPKYVIEKNINWDIGAVLTICFMTSNQKLNSNIMSIANEWTKYANIKFDPGDWSDPALCTKRPNSLVRVAYDWPGNPWALVGKHALSQKTNEPTINLKNYDSSPPNEPEYTWIILHEFGHILGFDHEFRNPDGNCDDEFNWDKVIKKYGSNTKKLKTIKNSSAFNYSEYDSSSVMRYYFDPELFLNSESSKCFGEKTNKLSTLDKKGASTIYPFQYDPLNNLIDENKDDTTNPFLY